VLEAQVNRDELIYSTLPWVNEAKFLPESDAIAELFSSVESSERPSHLFRKEQSNLWDWIQGGRTTMHLPICIRKNTYNQYNGVGW